MPRKNILLVGSLNSSFEVEVGGDKWPWKFLSIKPRLSGAALLADMGWPLSQSTAHNSSFPQTNKTKMRWKSSAQPSAVPWEGILHGTCETYGERRKRINLRFLRYEERFPLSGILWRLFLTQNCRSPSLPLYHIQSFMGQVRLTRIVVSICSRPSTWTVGLCTGATPTFSISSVTAQCWSTRKQLLRCPLGNQSTRKQTWGLLFLYQWWIKMLSIW